MDNSIFTEKSIPRTYLSFATPLVCSMIVTMIYNLVDTYFVAATGNTDLVAGISLVAPMFTLLMAYGNVYGQGGSSLSARYLGEGNQDSVRHVSALCFYICLFTSIAITAVLLLLRTPVLHLLGATTDTWQYAMDYYTWYIAGGTFTVISFVFTNLMRSVGKAKQAMVATISGSVLNMILDPAFIFGLGMGAKGAAIASVCGFALQDAICLLIVIKKVPVLSLRPRETSLPGEDIRMIYGIGIPAAITNIMAMAASVLLNHFLLPFGNAKIAAMGIAGRASTIVTLLMSGLTFGGLPLFGYFFGARDREHFMKTCRFAACLIGGVAITMTVILEIAAPGLIRQFMDNAQIVTDGTLMLRLQILMVVFGGWTMLMTIIFQATGNVSASFLLSICRQGVFFVAALFICRYLFGYYGVLSAQPIVDVLSCILAALLLHRQLKRLGKEW